MLCACTLVIELFLLLKVGVWCPLPVLAPLTVLACRCTAALDNEEEPWLDVDDSDELLTDSLARKLMFSEDFGEKPTPTFKSLYKKF